MRCIWMLSEGLVSCLSHDFTPTGSADSVRGDGISDYLEALCDFEEEQLRFSMRVIRLARECGSVLIERDGWDVGHMLCFRKGSLVLTSYGDRFPTEYQVMSAEDMMHVMYGRVHVAMACRLL